MINLKNHNFTPVVVLAVGGEVGGVTKFAQGANCLGPALWPMIVLSLF